MSRWREILCTYTLWTIKWKSNPFSKVLIVSPTIYIMLLYFLKTSQIYTMSLYLTSFHDVTALRIMPAYSSYCMWELGIGFYFINQSFISLESLSLERTVSSADDVNFVFQTIDTKIYSDFAKIDIFSGSRPFNQCWLFYFVADNVLSLCSIILRTYPLQMMNWQHWFKGCGEETWGYLQKTVNFGKIRNISVFIVWRQIMVCPLWCLRNKASRYGIPSCLGVFESTKAALCNCRNFLL